MLLLSVGHIPKCRMVCCAGEPGVTLGTLAARITLQTPADDHTRPGSLSVDVLGHTPSIVWCLPQAESVSRVQTVCKLAYMC